MERPQVDSRTRDWYSVSVDTLRAWSIVLGLAVLVAVGFFGYRYWERHDVERRASEEITQARLQASRLRNLDLPEGFLADRRRGELRLTQATSALAQGDFRVAYERGRESREIFEAIGEATGRAGEARVARIVSLDGRVEYRRGEGGSWESARPRLALYSGDHVKTGANGSVNILFDDGTHYLARPDTQFVLTRTRDASGAAEQSIQMDYGWVNLNTRESGGTVATPDAEARVAGESEAAVAYDAETRSGRFATYRGEMEVSAGDGEARRVGELEELVQSAGALAEPVPLPPAPSLEMPEDNLDLEAARDAELVLAWQPVESAQSYALQVSASHLFVDNVIDVTGRRKTSATLGVRGEGVFHWRVAASGTGGALGPWSETRRFRVAAASEPEAGPQREPPPLAIDEIESYGSIFLVRGRTEPGVTLSINGEPVGVAADGGFSKTVQFTTPGWSFIEVRARDGRGTEAVVTRRVHVEIL